MTVKRDARPHLDKATEYLDAARIVLAEGYYNPAVSLAVTAGINSNDVICILSVGHTDRSDNHDKAVDKLRKSGPTGKKMADTLGRLLGKKTKSQYSSGSVSATDANDAVTRAGRLVDAARDLFNATK